MSTARVRLVIPPINGAERTIDLLEGLVGVGRAPGSTVRLDEPEVSARHAELAWSTHGRLQVRDLASTNGTFVNDLPVSDWTVTANSVAKEWVLEEITAAGNLRIPVVPAVLEHVRLPDELRFLLQRTQFVDVSGLSASSDDSARRSGAIHALDDALLGVLERRGALNPDRMRMRVGRLLEIVGALLLLVGFGGFAYSAFHAVSTFADDAGAKFASFPASILPFFGLFVLGMVVAGSGSAMVGSGRAEGLRGHPLPVDNSLALKDRTVFGRQEPWEDSPPGWPRQWSAVSH